MEARMPLSSERATLIDAATLLAACGADGDGLRDLCEDFETFAPTRLTEIMVAFHAKDAARLREAAHKAYGLLATFSSAAGRAASDLEDHAAQGNLGGAASLVAQLESMVRRLLRDVNGLSVESLHRQAGTAPAEPRAWHTGGAYGKREGP